METKQFLKPCKQNPELLQHEPLEPVVALMFAHIGAPDAELRDHIIYSLFVEIILHQPVSTAQLLFIKQTALSNKGMFYNIGAIHTDCIFTRSFSTLLIPLLLERNKTDAFLTDSDIQDVKHAIIHYLKTEKDFRGYVPEKGWAHSLAHIADGIHSVWHYGWTAAEFVSILYIVRSILEHNEFVLTNQEEERMLYAIMPGLVDGLIDQPCLQQWIDLFSNVQPSHDPATDYILLHNTKVFLSALYFKLKQYPHLLAAADHVETVIFNVQQKFY
ncbi:DUF2785 domain-containing protein [Paenibacillus campi]|uniref:DUF2785 domain-containing protein n=1 Tax=Paenibacillus campi TaxID=3106031 RepID=UPI002AFDD7D6|nr:DUF2785 domain-containing protein [Paenibacillus sp. SGZ-1014]